VQRLTINKIGEDRYHVTADDPEFGLIDEYVDDVQLLGMLITRKPLGMTAEEILKFLDEKEIGYYTAVLFE
jgi:hypothetical protein